MNVPAKVALIGSSRSGLEARAAVLEHFWQVETVLLEAEPAEDGSCLACEAKKVAALEAKAEGDAELFVVSSSIAEPQRQEWVERIRAQHPEALIVRLNGFDSGPKAGAHATVSDERGPGALVSTIYELLTERGLASRAWPGEPEGGWVQ